MSEFGAYLAQLRSHLDLDPKRADEVCAEVRSHLEARAAQLVAAGRSREDAAAEAARSFGEPSEVARGLTAANTRYRSLRVFRLICALALSVGGLFIVLGGLADAYQPLIGWLVRTGRLSTQTAFAVAIVALSVPGFVFAGMVVTRRDRWVPSLSPVLLVTGLCVVALREVAYGVEHVVRDALVWLAFLVGATALGLAVLLGSRLRFRGAARYAFGAGAGIYYAGISVAGLCSLLNAHGVLASLAVAEAVLAALALSALWDRWHGMSRAFWAGLMLLAVCVTVMIVAATTRWAYHLGYATSEAVWWSILVAETCVWVAFAGVYRLSQGMAPLHGPRARGGSQMV